MSLQESANSFVELKDVTRRYGETRAIDDLSLTIGKGEIICLVGRSGCGKSTLLRAIAGVEMLDGGSISLNGRTVAGPSGFVEPEHRRIGFVFQDYALFPHLSVRENVLFGLKCLPKGEAFVRADDVLDRIGIAVLRDRYPHMLSGGEQQRVALARALAPKPDLLLMDEPFSNLDRGLRESVREETLSLLRGFGTTVIMVTHDPEEALSAGDRVVLMRAGRIVQVGTGEDLHARPVEPYAAEFFTAFNRIPGVYRDGHVETVIGRFAHRLALADGRPAVVYVRPHALQIDEEHGTIIGRVLKRRFIDGGEQLFLGVDDLEQPLLLNRGGVESVSAETIRCSIRSDGLLAFPA